MSRDPRVPSEERKNPNIERPDPFNDEQTSYELDSAQETDDEEYKAGGLPKTSKYSVDKKHRSEPSVSTPEDKKEQSDRPVDANYGF